VLGDVTDGVLNRLDEITHYKPATLFLLIGINDLFNLYYQKQIPSTDYIAQNIVKITQRIHEQSPKTKVYVQTVLPTAEAYMAEYINAVNAGLKRQEASAHYELIPLFDAFVGEDGLIKPEFTSDGTHLNEAGYQHWVAILKNYLKK
ncbi:MAG: GDSL-type esterase/lipase family protein, partial [Bacteroidota bacterium]